MPTSKTPCAWIAVQAAAPLPSPMAAMKPPSPRSLSVCCAARGSAPMVGRRQRLLCRRRASHRRAHRNVDPVHFRHLGLPAGENALGVMRLAPALEKARRNRKVDAFLLHVFEVHSREPA